MNVLVDTSVWSLALRRKAPLSAADARLREELAELIEEGRARLIGPIRQELLSGLAHEQQYVKVRDHLRAFADEVLGRDDYEQAAAVGNRCRRTGLAGSAVDFLICAVASARGWSVCTTDGDFRRFAEVVPVELHLARR